MNSETALVLFSGGQDSTVCLAWALERFSCVETVGFDYGQRHAIELSVRARLREKMSALNSHWAARLGDDHMIKLDALAAISDTALTRQTDIEIADSGLPTTFVPGRNLMFFCFAGRLPTGAAPAISSPACAKQTTPVIPTAATTPLKQCRSRSRSASTSVWPSIRR
jgi:7-cyano-7-deazaguanine synthase